jgi:tRNA A-37 threonylcarbamoyl transferase component Bud32
MPRRHMLPTVQALPSRILPHEIVSDLIFSPIPPTEGVLSIMTSFTRTSIIAFIIVALLTATLTACSAAPAMAPAAAPVSAVNGMSTYRGLPVSQLAATGEVAFTESYQGTDIAWKLVSDQTGVGGVQVYQSDIGIFMRKLTDIGKFTREKNALLLEEQAKGMAGKLFAFDEANLSVYSVNGGATLLDLVEKQGWTAANVTAYHDAEALAAKMHDLGVEIGDLGPSNVLVSTDSNVMVADAEIAKFKGEFGFVDDPVEAAMLRRQAFTTRFKYQTEYVTRQPFAMTYEQALDKSGIDCTIEGLFARAKSSGSVAGVAVNGRDVWLIQRAGGSTVSVDVPAGTKVSEAAVSEAIAGTGASAPSLFWVRAWTGVKITATVVGVVILVWDFSDWLWENNMTGLLPPAGSDESLMYSPTGDFSVEQDLVTSGYEGMPLFRIYRGPQMDSILAIMRTSVAFAVNDPTLTRILKDDRWMDLWINRAAFKNMNTGIKITPVSDPPGQPWPYGDQTGIRLKWWTDDGQEIDVYRDPGTGKWTIATENRTIELPMAVKLGADKQLNCRLVLTMKEDGSGPYEDYRTVCP